ncbi:3-oxoacyl-[acyl-carrier protein] reductase [Capronia coronata CBS 617.96]|uniref:3-oxoacyl-[acyl-carrier-protein] reductase n=1 Tax=Capronia coronata CBS 617.96 TaxID=1182541 RepID=W9XZD3_9EURO|nr:3-oxoacyl-[acyl-carrier protein] reductase [Capronia coronata CBS 617.96]EXJ85593.1 3-oxoacyl-[acyl-carrier protein] reductase [Capronia coronata CBS 617.96]
MKLQDQIVLVTGSSRGLGLAIAKAFRAEGAQVVLNYFQSDPEQISRLAEELEAFPFRADVANPDDVNALFAAAEAHFHRPITTVVNNAIAGGFAFNGDARPKVAQLTWSDFDAQLQGFLRGTLNTTQAALPGFEKARFGRIVNIGSNLVQNPVVPYHDYTAAKGALLAFTRTCAADLGPKGITVNLVAGGLLETTDASAKTPRVVFDQIKAVTPLRKVTTPQDLAGAVLFFASPWADGVTGQQMVVDGGLVMN